MSNVSLLQLAVVVLKACDIWPILQVCI